MAPLKRGSASVRHHSPARGSSKGQRHGYGRGGHKSTPKNRMSSSFKTTRIEEKASSDSERSDSIAAQTIHPRESSAGYSDDEAEQGQDKAQINPYTMLLQHLATTPQPQPQKKKRKRHETEEKEHAESSENDKDFVEEAENLEVWGEDDYVDSDDEVGPQEDYSPFDLHFAKPEESQLAEMIENVKTKQWVTLKKELTPTWSSISNISANSTEIFSIRNEPVRNTAQISLRRRLREPAARLLPNFNPLNGYVASSIFNYQDVVFPHRTPDTRETLRNISCLHFLNHLSTTRDKIVKNNDRVAAASGTEDVEYRDQGFTRPRVLVILPTRQSCAKYVDTMVALLEPAQQENKKRFQDSYTSKDDHFSHSKPEDFEELFKGNDDDMFRLGIKFTRNTMKYFTQFYNSDIIFASPLGLRMALGMEDSKKKDYDFLSSIEIVIVDQADSLAMQNWEHLEYIFEHLNLQPKEAHGCDFSRVRNWYLDNNARFLRQTILISAFNFPSLNRLYTHHMSNVAGKVKYQKPHEGMILDLGIQVKQRFSRFETTSAVADPDDRFNYFTTTIVPYITKNTRDSDQRKDGLLIYLPLYADFVRVRNYLSTSPSAQSISFGSISEYTSNQDVSRARSHLLTGRHSVLLYTERAHHFRRYQIKGVKSVIMYGLPENPLFYKEVVAGFLGSSLIGGGAAMPTTMDASSLAYNVRSLFSRFDVFKLERVVGTKRVSTLLKNSGGDTFDFF